VDLLLFYILYYVNFLLVYFYITHQVLIGLPQGVGGLAILLFIIFSLFS
jgi:hypothetical protein